MSRLLVRTVAVVFAALTTPTIAAKAAPVVTPPIYNWSGCYFGGNVGWQSARTSGILNIDNGSLALGGPVPGGPAPSSFSLGAGNTPSFIGGGQVGCNYQSGQFVFGIEGDADWRRLSRTGYLLPGAVASSRFDEFGNFSLTSNWQASLRGRLGYAVDHTLWYATGGIAWTRLSLRAHVSLLFDLMEDSGLYDTAPVSTPVGWTLGGGVEYAVREDVTIGLEGRYTRYGSHHFNTLAVPDPAPIFPATGDLNVNSSEIIGKVNFRFNSNSQSTEPPPMRPMRRNQ